MIEGLIPLNELQIGSVGKVKMITTDGIIRRRMLDLGLIEGTNIEPLRRSPSGDPTAYEIRGAVIAFRDEEASKIFVKKK